MFVTGKRLRVVMIPSQYIPREVHGDFVEGSNAGISLDNAQWESYPHKEWVPPRPVWIPFTSIMMVEAI